MDRNTLNVAFFCAMGALMGYLLGVEIGNYAANYFANGQFAKWLGAPLGGVIGYLAIDFRYLCGGIASAWRTAIGFRPDMPYWKAWFATLLTFCSLFANALVVAVIVTPAINWVQHMIIEPSTEGAPDFFLMGNILQVGLISSVVWLIASLVLGGLGATLILSACARSGGSLKEIQTRSLRGALLINPLAVTYWLLCELAYLVRTAPGHTRAATTAVKRGWQMFVRFLAQVAINVHSSRRKLVFVCATIGAGIGLLFGSAIIGTIAGGVLGVISYQLVTVRILKLAPTR